MEARRLTLTDQTRGDAIWEEYLTPVPLSIAIMTDLVFMCSDTDFSINKNPPEGGFRFLRNPDSFHACLMQVCNSGWQAFNEAHSSMDQIRLHSAMTPEYLREVLEIESQGNSEDVQILLPLRLKRIISMSEECLRLALATRCKFHQVSNLIQELLEACINAGEEQNIKRKIKNIQLIKRAAAEPKTKAVHDTQKVIVMDHQSSPAMAGGFTDIVKFLTKPFLYKSKPATSKEASDTKPHPTDRVGIDKDKVKRDRGRTSENTRFSIKQIRAQLEKAVEKYNKSTDNITKQERELNDNVVTENDLKIKGVTVSSIHTAIQLLRKGLDALRQVEEQWHKMVLFFQVLSDAISASFSPKLINVLSQSEDNRKHISREPLSTMVFKALDVSILVNMIADIYMEVSSMYLMSSISRLARLFTIDPRKKAFLQERELLLKSCQEAQRTIRDLVLKNKKMLKAATVSKQDRNEGQLKEIQAKSSLKICEMVKET